MINPLYYMFDNKLRPFDFVRVEIVRERRLIPKKLLTKVIRIRLAENKELRRLTDRVIIEERSSPRLFGQRDSTQAHNKKSIEKHLRGERTKFYD